MLFPTELPPELIFHVLSYLALQSLETLHSLSREWDTLLAEHEAYIYRNAALLHGFIPSNEVTLEDALIANKPFLADLNIDSWRAFCQLRLGLEAGWAGRADMTWKKLSSNRVDVHRIKVDEQVGIVITTHQDGGLNVRDIDTDEVLWGLPRTYVRNYAHCEYDKGFLIFDRFGQAKEVWRLASQYDSSPAPPEEFQTEVSFTINQYFSPSKGHFRPWAVLNIPEFGRAFRFVYPILAVVGAQTAHLYDVTTCEISKTIADIQVEANGKTLGEINYVELDSLHVYICGSNQLRIFDRTSGALIYSIASTDQRIVDHGITVHRRPEFLVKDGVSAHPLASHIGTPQKSKLSMPEFVAVHVNTDGKSVACLLTDCRLLLIKDVTELVKGQQKLGEHAMEVVLGCATHEPDASFVPCCVYLAMAHGRVGVVTNFGIFILTVDASLYGLVDPGNPGSLTKAATTSTDEMVSLVFPFVKACRLLPFAATKPLRAVSCLQMTPRRMFFAWHRRYLPTTVSNHPSLVPWISLDDSSSARREENSLIIGYDENGTPVALADLGLDLDEFNFEIEPEDDLVIEDENDGDLGGDFDFGGDFDDFGGGFDDGDDGDQGEAPFVEELSNKIVVCADFTAYENPATVHSRYGRQSS